MQRVVPVHGSSVRQLLKHFSDLDGAIESSIRPEERSRKAGDAQREDRENSDAPGFGRLDAAAPGRDFATARICCARLLSHWIKGHEIACAEGPLGQWIDSVIASVPLSVHARARKRLKPASEEEHYEIVNTASIDFPRRSGLHRVPSAEPMGLQMSTLSEHTEHIRHS